MNQKVFGHGRKLTLLAAAAMLVACGGGGGSGSDGRLQIITFKYPGGNTLLNGPTVLSATANSGLDVTYRTGTPETCTVSGNQLTLVSAGECLVIASQAGGSKDGVNWAAADDVSQLFNVLKKPQLPLGMPVGAVLLAATDTVNLPAVTDGSLPITYASTTPFFCTVSGTALTLNAVGPCILSATAVEDAQHAAMSLAVLLPVGSKPPALVPRNGKVGHVALASVNSAGAALSYASTTPSVCKVEGRDLQLLAKGSCEVTATAAGGATWTDSVIVDPLLIADGFSQTAGTGEGYSDQIRTAQGGGVTVNPWDSTLNAGWERCDAGHPDWCYHTVSADGTTLTSALEVPKGNFPTGWHYGFNKIDIFVPGKTKFDDKGDTTGGLRVTTEATVGFTMGVSQGLYTAGKPIVLYLDLGKWNGSCNVELATLVWPKAPGSVTYNVPLSNFAVTNNCGIAGVTAASVDNNIRKLPNPWDSQGNPTNLGAFNTALDGFKDARTSATNLLKSSDIVRFRLRLFDPNDTIAGPAFYSSSISISGAITIY